jgi:hypothetical protein
MLVWFRRNWLWLVIVAVVLALVLVWPCGVATGWGWGWGHPQSAGGQRRAARQAERTVQAVEGPCPAKEPKAIAPDGTLIVYVVGDRDPTGQFVCGPDGWVYLPVEAKDEGLEVTTESVTETAEVVWSDPDAFDATAAPYPLGDATAWTYVQCWDGKTVTSTIHVAWAPNLKLVVNDYVGTRWQVWDGPDVSRWEEMRREVMDRDDLGFLPPLYVIHDLDSAGIQQLPKNWEVAALFEAAATNR